MQEQLIFYIIKRIFLGIITFLVILFINYALLRLAPGDPSKSSFLDSAGNMGEMQSDKSNFGKNMILHKKLHLDKPMPVGFVYWLQAAVKGDFGVSVAVDKGRPVTEMIMERLPVTVRLNLLAILLTYLLAVPIGITAASHEDSHFDRITMVFLFFLYSLPALWVALMLQSVFCKGGMIPVLPLKGIVPLIRDGMSTWRIMLEHSLHYVLPVFCMSYGGFASLTKFTRQGMLEVIHQEYIRTAYSKGVSDFGVIYVHAFRNALILMITLFAGILPSLVSGSILIEYIFNIPGMGSLSMTALSSRDIPLVMALFSFSGFLTLSGILLADILYVLADPRIRYDMR